MIDIQLRPSQLDVVRYEGGKMGVAAVPGAGKTTTLSHLAANLIERLTDAGRAGDQEVLIVTLTNSAVNAFRGRISRLVQQERGLLPYIGYRVRTLHSLAHDIVRMRPGLVGLSEGFEIIDERVSNDIVRGLADGWIRNNGDRLIRYLNLPMAGSDEQFRHLIRQNGPEMIQTVAREIIRLAKDNLWEPAALREGLEEAEAAWPDAFVLAEIGVEMYEGYQRSLAYRGAVDFDDLVKLAMQALEFDPTFLARLQERWPYILEDESQDSSRLQERMLGMLSGERNWVRVGDPNQAIFTTFTTADSNLLINFIRRPDVESRPLPVSGRCSPAIISLANELVRWSNTNPDLPPELHKALSSDPLIEPTSSDDPQANPPDGSMHMDWEPGKNITPEEEIRRVVISIGRWLPDHEDWTVAVLVPENSRGYKMAEALREADIPYEELLRSTSATRDAAERLFFVLFFLSQPTNSKALGRLYAEVWWPINVDFAGDEGELQARDDARDLLNSLKFTEDFIWPGLQGDWLETVKADLTLTEFERLGWFRERVKVWLDATTLPIDQVILTVAGDIFIPVSGEGEGVQADLALAHKLALLLRSIAESNPDFRLAELSNELSAISANERRFIGFDDTSSGYEPAKGKVTVATMHAAKGLEWDRVYLLALNNYSFPSAIPGDNYIAEKWFIRDELNIQAETREQVERIMAGEPERYREGEASLSARVSYAAERLRLLYVGITRAKRDLIITWNMGRFWKDGRQNAPAQPLIALTRYWQENLKHDG
jgi:DNA helicase-2/ATP-dependent DNA helicase PcrA